MTNLVTDDELSNVITDESLSNDIVPEVISHTLTDETLSHTLTEEQLSNLIQAKVELMGAPKTAYYVLTQPHGDLPNASLVTDIDHDILVNTHNLTTDIDHNTITNTHDLTVDIDHNTITNTHDLTVDIDHNTITNTHDLTDDIDHDTITNTHNLTTDIDHNQLTNTHDLTVDIDHNTITNTHNLSTDLVPAGNDGEIQYNDSGSFAAETALFWDKVNKRLGIKTSSPGSTLTIAGGNLELDTTGSSAANPTTIAMSHFTGATKYSRYEFGNNLNSMQAKTGGMFQIQSYWGIQIAGSRESGTPLGFGNTTTFDPSLNVLGRVAGNVVLAVTGGSSQSADLQQWRNGAGTPLSVIDNEGKAGFGTSNPDRLLHVSSPDGKAILRLERADAAIYTDDIYGKIEWEGKDLSTGAAGVRVEIEVKAFEHLGATIWTFSKAGASSNTLVPVMTFNQFHMVDFPYGMKDLKLQSAEPWLQSNVLGSIALNKEIIRWNSHSADTSTGMTGDVGKIALIAELDFSGQQAKTAWVFYTHTGRADTNPIREAMRINNNMNLIVQNNITGERITGSSMICTGDSRVDGDLFFTGDGSGLPFGNIYTNDTIAVTIGTAGVPVEVGDTWTAGEFNNASFGASHFITIGKAGRYKTDWSMSVAQNSPSSQIEMEGCIMVDGTQVTGPGRVHRTVKNATDIGALSGTAILDLASAAQVSLCITNETNTTNIDVEHGNLSIVHIGGT